MSDDTVIKTLCTKCGAVYELGREAIGQTASCGACNAEFEVQDYTDYINKMLSEQNAGEAQTPEPVPEEPPAVSGTVPEKAPEAEVTEDGTVKMEPKSPTSTNTVRLPKVKAATGMLPQIEGERVKIATQTNKSLSSGTRKSTLGRKFSSGTNRTTAAPAPKKKSFWDLLCFWKK